MRLNTAKLLAFVILFICACSNKPGIVYKPSQQILPSNIKSLAVRPFINRTNYFGLEEKLTLAVNDELLKDATLPVVVEEKADGVVVGTINRYILTPIQYDAAMTPSVYKLLVVLEVRLYDRKNQKFLWTEPSLEAVQIYSAPALAGGMTEEAARLLVWEKLARSVVKRVMEGYGSVASPSERKLLPTEPIPASPR